MRTRRSPSSSDPVSEPHDANALRGEGHRTVLLHEAVDALELQSDDIVVDCTLGGAGHAREIARKLGRGGFFVGFDLDSDAIDRAEAALAGEQCKVALIHANFREMKSELEKRGIPRIDKALFDLGWSGYQLSAGRGFSFLADEPLAMNYGATKAGLNAATIVNEWSESSLADIIFGWGGERYSRRIAKAIVERRETKPFSTSRELADVIREAVPPAYRRGKLHPATKTFQALRIAVNDELGALKDGLAAAQEMLAPGGRIAVIAFHSLEDRLVKQTFLAWERASSGIRVSKKPLKPSASEIQHNPRSRSATLRIFQSHDQSSEKNQQIQAVGSAGEPAA